jgi:hypothetical protein
MYIKKEDFGYFENLYKTFDEQKQKKFIAVLIKAAGAKSGDVTIKRIQVVGDEIFDERGVEAGEFITRTMIKKAYKAAKGE